MPRTAIPQPWKGSHNIKKKNPEQFRNGIKRDHSIVASSNTLQETPAQVSIAPHYAKSWELARRFTIPAARHVQPRLRLLLSRSGAADRPRRGVQHSLTCEGDKAWLQDDVGDYMTKSGQRLDRPVNFPNCDKYIVRK